MTSHNSYLKELEPQGKIHIPIGIPDTLDTLKTFVEAEGNFSPGVGSYGIYFWIYEPGALTAPTMERVECDHELHREGYLIPRSRWKSGDVVVETEVCEVRRESLGDDVYVAGARVHLTNSSEEDRKILLYAALRPLGAAGWSINRMEASGSALLVDDHSAIVAEIMPSKIGVLPSSTIGDLAFSGEVPAQKTAISETGDCSGAMQFDLTISPGETKTLGFVCPVLPGRRAARHEWVDLGQGALADMAELNSAKKGSPQPDPGLAYYRKLKADDLFSEAVAFWENLLGRITVKTPDSRWEQGMRAMLGHAGLCMNEGAADVAVVNYNVFNRDGMYVANMMQKSGLFGYAKRALDYFLSHPFNGRAYPEADNPGQILWSLGQQWLFTRDADWLCRVYPSVQKISAMIDYYRTNSRPYWVDMDSLDFGTFLPENGRWELKLGRCDGHHPEYTEAFDIAGLRSAAILAEAHGNTNDATTWRSLADSLFQLYDDKFGSDPGKGYGNYSVLWPCRLYPLGKAEKFRGIGAKASRSWRYFPLATAHQGLLAGNREAGYGTVSLHLDEEQMRGWYAFDEGGGSSSGGWHRLRTNWTRSVEEPGANLSVAMPHGWAISELWLLMRDCLMFEDDRGRIILLGGVSPDWFRHSDGMEIRGLETYYGKCNFSWTPQENGAMLELSGAALPPNGFVLRLPPLLKPTVILNRERLAVAPDGDCYLPAHAKRIYIEFD